MNDTPRENKPSPTGSEGAQISGPPSNMDRFLTDETALGDADIPSVDRILSKAEVLYRDEKDLVIANELAELEVKLLGIKVEVEAARGFRDDAWKELGIAVRTLRAIYSREFYYAETDTEEDLSVLSEKRVELAEAMKEIRKLDSQLGGRKDLDISSETARKSEPTDPDEKVAYFQRLCDVAESELASQLAEGKAAEAEVERARGAAHSFRSGRAKVRDPIFVLINAKTYAQSGQELVDIANMVYYDMRRELKTGVHYPAAPRDSYEAKAHLLRQVYWPDQLRLHGYVNLELLGRSLHFHPRRIEHPPPADPPYTLRDIRAANDPAGQDPGPQFYLNLGEEFPIEEETWRIAEVIYRGKYGDNPYVDLERVRNPQLE